MNKLRAAIEEAEDQIQHHMFSVGAACEQRAARNSQALQKQLDNAQRTHFHLQDRNQEVLMINAMLRTELAELRRQNKAYKQQLELHEQECQIGVIGLDGKLHCAVSSEDGWGSQNQAKTEDGRQAARCT
jgi:hypothetical protein